jgi:hypothetical protein
MQHPPRTAGAPSPWNSGFQGSRPENEAHSTCHRKARAWWNRAIHLSVDSSSSTAIHGEDAVLLPCTAAAHHPPARGGSPCSRGVRRASILHPHGDVVVEVRIPSDRTYPLATPGGGLISPPSSQAFIS